MSSLIEDTPRKKISVLLDQIHERIIALPDFQRDFVWDPGATEELIASIAMDYPAGSILAIQNTHNYFATREIEGAPKLNGNKPSYIILDGQQRLTSLYQAFYGVGDYRYLIKINDIINGKDIEEALFHIRISAKRGWQVAAYKKYFNPNQIEAQKAQASDMILPFNILFTGKFGYLGWVDAITDDIIDVETRKNLKTQLMNVHYKIIQNIEGYQFPVVLLSDSTPVDAVCTIFETLNRTGVKLSVFDLLAARFWPDNVKIRDMWDSSIIQHPIINEFSIDPYYILQILTLTRKETALSCKRKDVLGLTPTYVNDNWDKAFRGLTETLDILQKECGVLSPKWIPYSTIVIPFAAIMSSHIDEKGLKLGETKQKLKKWFWCSVFSQKYETSPNSQSAKDVAEVESWINGGNVPPDIA